MIEGAYGRILKRLDEHHEFIRNHIRENYIKKKDVEELIDYYKNYILKNPRNENERTANYWKKEFIEDLQKLLKGEG